MPIVHKRTAQPITHVFADDGNIPNNVLPLVLYRGGIDLTGSPDPEALIEKTFTVNGWRGLWRNGIYPYVHYHSMIHEAMAVARGRAKVRFGGDNGEAIDVMAGDVVVLPAGTVPTSRAVRSRPDLSLKSKVNLHPSSILVRGSPL
jgi:uncharacterized protein YjlB